MMKTSIIIPCIRNIEFINSSIMFVHLDNDRTFIVPLDKFPAIKNLSPKQRKSYEIIDDQNLSFVDIDDIYSIHDLIGL